MQHLRRTVIRSNSATDCVRDEYVFFQSLTASLERRKFSLHGGTIKLVTKHPSKPIPEYPVKDEKSGWHIDSIRTGAIAKKVGMTSRFDAWGIEHPVTILEVPDSIVTAVKTEEKDGYTALQIGAGSKKLKQMTMSELGRFAKADVPPRREGTPITARHFVPGQHVDVSGKTIGKGFQGGMKRWGFSGGNASHGNSLAHRALGATGARTDPGKVWKGKKMPGRMGGKVTTIRNLKVFSIIPATNRVLLRGAVPGKPGTWLKLRDNWLFKFTEAPPFPTHFAKDGEETPEEIIASFENPWSQFDSSVTTPEQFQKIRDDYAAEVAEMTEDMRQVLVRESTIIRKSARGSTEFEQRSVASLVEEKK